MYNTIVVILTNRQGIANLHNPHEMNGELNETMALRCIKVGRNHSLGTQLCHPLRTNVYIMLRVRSHIDLRLVTNPWLDFDI